MARLIYSMITSLDGYVADEDGNFDWAEPDEEVHSFINELERAVGTHLLGRRMYEVLSVWDTLPLTDQPAYIQDFAEAWRAADKIVYSRTLPSLSSPNAVLEREFDAEAVRRIKAEAERDLAVGGPELAGQAVKAGLADDVHLFVVPFLAGGGHHVLPASIRLPLELLSERRFGNGTIYAAYHVKG
jgi:dihydrofolate reductase